jgi:hypothetical protein
MIIYPSWELSVVYLFHLLKCPDSIAWKYGSGLIFKLPNYPWNTAAESLKSIAITYITVIFEMNLSRQDIETTTRTKKQRLISWSGGQIWDFHPSPVCFKRRLWWEWEKKNESSAGTRQSKEKKLTFLIRSNEFRMKNS